MINAYVDGASAPGGVERGGFRVTYGTPLLWAAELDDVEAVKSLLYPRWN